MQTAVNALSKTGYMLSTGLLENAKTTARRESEHKGVNVTHLPPHALSLRSAPWVGDLKRTVASVRVGDDSGVAALAAVEQLSRAEDLRSAKDAFVSATESLTSWVAAAGLASKVKGL